MSGVEAEVGPQFKGKKVVITGGLGFIGSNLGIRLGGLGADVTLYTRSLDKVYNIHGLQSRFKIIQGKITDKERVKNAVMAADFIFHLAAQTSNITSMEDPFGDTVTNIEGTLTLLEACRQYCAKAAFVSTGTITQGGKPVVLPIDESHRDMPLTIYDVNKLACENYLRVYHDAFGIDAVFLRLATVYGERQQLTNTRNGIVNYFIGKALIGETIKIFGDGMFLRDYLYVQDLVDALILAATCREAAGESFITATGSGTEFVEMVKTIISTVRDVTGRQAEYVHVDWPSDWKAVDVGSVVGSPAKLRKICGWHPRTTFADGIRKTVEFYSSRLKSYS